MYIPGHSIIKQAFLILVRESDALTTWSFNASSDALWKRRVRVRIDGFGVGAGDLGEAGYATDGVPGFVGCEMAGLARCMGTAEDEWKMMKYGRQG